MMKRIFVFLFVLLWSVPVWAIQILATVQDEIITDLDVEERSALVEKMFKVPADEELKKNILEDLVNEKVKLLTAQKNGIVLSEAQIADGISFLEKQNQMASGDLEKFIAENGLSFDSLKAQVVADLMWLRYVQEQNLKQPKISDKQVETELKKMQEKLSSLGLDSDMQEFIQISQLIINENDYLKIKEDLQKASSSCMTFTQFAMQNGVQGSNSGAIPEIMTAQLPADMQQLLKGKSLNELIGPVNMSPYLLFVMKCGSKVKSVLPEKELIKERLQGLEMEKILADLLKKQRQKMVVEFK